MFCLAVFYHQYATIKPSVECRVWTLNCLSCFSEHSVASCLCHCYVSAAATVHIALYCSRGFGWFGHTQHVIVLRVCVVCIVPLYRLQLIKVFDIHTRVHHTLSPGCDPLGVWKLADVIPNYMYTIMILLLLIKQYRSDGVTKKTFHDSIRPLNNYLWWQLHLGFHLP